MSQSDLDVGSQSKAALSRIYGAFSVPDLERQFQQFSFEHDLPVLRAQTLLVLLAACAQAAYGEEISDQVQIGIYVVLAACMMACSLQGPLQGAFRAHSATVAFCMLQVFLANWYLVGDLYAYKDAPDRASMEELSKLPPTDAEKDLLAKCLPFAVANMGSLHLVFGLSVMVLFFPYVSHTQTVFCLVVWQTLVPMVLYAKRPDFHMDLWQFRPWTSIFLPLMLANLMLMFVNLDWCIWKRRTFFYSERLKTFDPSAKVVVSRSPVSQFLESMARSIRVDSVSGHRAALGGDPQPWMVNAAELQWGPLIGRGGRADVYSCEWRGVRVACKRLRGNFREVHDGFADEITTLYEMRHPNLLLFMGISVYQGHLLLVTEYMSLGSLDTVLYGEERQVLTPYTMLEMVKQIAMGLEFLHTAQPPIFHMDIKPANVLVDKNLSVKLGDFGFNEDAALKTDGERSTRNVLDVVGTINYMPPEVMRGDKASGASDVFSLGMVLYEIWAVEPPFFDILQDGTPLQLLYLVGDMGGRPPFTAKHPSDVRALIEQCWDQTPGRRPTAAEVKDKAEELAQKRMLAHGPTMESTVSLRRFNSAHVIVQRKGGGGNKRQSISEDSAGPIVVLELLDRLGVWARRPAAMAEASRLIVALVSEFVEQCPARTASVVTSQGGFFVLSIRNPQLAIDFARKMRTELPRLEWPRELLNDNACVAVPDNPILRGLRPLIGVHFGELAWMLDDVTDTHVPTGPALADSLQLARMARSGEVMVSSEFFLQFERELPGQMLEHSKGALVYLLAGTKLETLDPADPDAEMSDTEEALDADEDGAHGPGSMRRTDTPASLKRGSVLERLVLEAEAGEDASVGSGAELGADLTGSLKIQRLSVRRSRNVQGFVLREAPLCEELLAESGSCVVYRGRARGKAVAVKQMRELTDRNQLLLFEASSMLSRLEHRNVAQFVGLWPGLPCPMLAWEYLDTTLSNLLHGGETEKRPWTSETALFVLKEVAAGMTFVHSQGGVHRDLRSSNVLVNVLAGGSMVVKVTDIGISRLQYADQPAHSVYSPPEVLRGRPASPAGDVYSFGMLIWEAVTRRRPFEGQPVERAVAKVMQGARPRILASFPNGVEQIVMRCWRGEPDDRPRMGQCEDMLGVVGDDGMELVEGSFRVKGAW